MSANSAGKGINLAAERYGFARIGLSTPDGYWTFGNDNVVNDANPMPCSDSDSKDIPYVRTVLDFIESRPDQFDSSRIWAEGFSQNSMFSAYIGFCFSDRILGVWQGGSGMALTGKKPNLPGCQGQCTASAFAAADNCNQCIASTPCTECQYWPIYPCYNPERPMIDCLADYTNDYIANDRNDASLSTAENMYNKLISEGHDARLLRFAPSEDGTITGGHQNPKNSVYWQVGCLGITEPCGSQCETSFSQCVNSLDVSTAANRVQSFEDCIGKEVFEELAGCTEKCAPTIAMLKQSEEPVKEIFNEFGAGTSTSSTRPSDSRCEI